MGGQSMNESPRAVLQQPGGSGWVAFERPVEVLETTDPGEIAPLLAALETATQQGLTAVGCFILAIPNRYLPILQEGKIEALRQAKQRAGRMGK